ncbi:uncharacterized protein ACLA_028060 [Aspergillus clavatus NRRL 1]|uniref:Uncharacterized protein n=1 Tax=Aspergillus clavatus (strain ATCC 1007 / CBS 513.65 / DSM 816 / NCTC 3887 / NRRL 1 / QM 1276 / 107) TaxID=344612 RepID=A1CR10_ASPCL|nr:uncharacterized protein ACLA_028060 [Aspergillus clavatus NRRL 1]EAW08081.1 hypothetical protein ACLA_028060 [Aspergillus clavatus NRRL 1]
MQQILENRLMESLLQIQTGKAADFIKEARSEETRGQGSMRFGWYLCEWSPPERVNELVTRKLGRIRLEGLESIQPFIMAPSWTLLEVTMNGKI